MIELCNCKINLGLYITARRPDGYHEIVTVMLPVAWGDIVEITSASPCPAIPSRGLIATTGYPVNCPPEKNLVMKAYRAIAQEVELPPLVLHLHKNVPDGAGLGGGSSDAAHTLLAINKECNLGLSVEKLQELAARIGADCPFFITSEPALCTGIGTTLQSLVCRAGDAPVSILLKVRYSLLIVKPPCSVSTKEAYAGVTPRPMDFDLVEAIRQPIETWKDRIHNQFEKSVFPLLPVLPEIKQKMYDMGAVYASMSGSGSAMYAIFHGEVPPLPAEWLANGWHHYIGEFDPAPIER
ncbi:MAG: 4-(cytidine 5'-diphospho)-2-C-methyl-D-erythritol kinase [Bacteroidales bacterium]|nr:4-(cytidine 5'-diphospho)-2-C-methyl-D-erythritol kinase [Bacteroidales bacterium]